MAHDYLKYCTIALEQEKKLQNICGTRGKEHNYIVESSSVMTWI